MIDLGPEGLEGISKQSMHGFDWQVALRLPFRAGPRCRLAREFGTIPRQQTAKDHWTLRELFFVWLLKRGNVDEGLARFPCGKAEPDARHTPTQVSPAARTDFTRGS